MVQWLRLHASSIAGGTDLIPGLGGCRGHDQNNKTNKRNKELRGEIINFEILKKKKIGFDHTVLTLKY